VTPTAQWISPHDALTFQEFAFYLSDASILWIHSAKFLLRFGKKLCSTQFILQMPDLLFESHATPESICASRLLSLGNSTESDF
jgi:hypothetical protein